MRRDRGVVDDGVPPLVDPDELGHQLGAVAEGVAGHRVEPELTL